MARKAGLAPSSGAAARAPGRALFHQDVSNIYWGEKQGSGNHPCQFPSAWPGAGSWERKGVPKMEMDKACQHCGPLGPPCPQLRLGAQQSGSVSCTPGVGGGLKNSASPVLCRSAPRTPDLLPSPSPVCRNARYCYLVETKPRCVISLEKYTVSPLPALSPANPQGIWKERAYPTDCCTKGYVS